ncbi:MAG TPA: membrane protein insertase YidC, partial [Bryobacteraceae bacterium]|nr:membrane protein insertase YidC [Bryobacteraceae bacterium]
MAESNNGGTTTGRPEPPKQISMELRLLLAFIMMGVVLFVTPYFFKSVAPPSPRKTATKTAQTPAQAPAAPTPAPAPATPAAPPVSAQAEETVSIETSLYQVSFSNRGGLVRNWQLKKFKAHTGKPLELVNSLSHVDRPFSFYFSGPKPSVDLNQSLYAVKRDADGLGVTFEYSNGQVFARKTFRFKPNSYLSEISTEVRENGKPIPALLVWRGGFGDMAVPNPSAAAQTLYFDTTNSKLIKNGAKAAKDGPVTFTGHYSFAGVEDSYFVAAFLPDSSAPVQTVTFSDSVRALAEEKEAPFAGVAVGSGPVNKFSAFVGPKDLDILRSVNPKLEQVVDFGWFSFLAKPLFLIVNWVNDHVIGNYGWAIILVTIALNFALFPLKISSMKSMKKMQALQPQIQAINEKYKNVGLRDPRKANQNQEVMELYKRYGVNPMGGCVPMALQIPFFFAFYKVFTVSVEMRGAHWLWVADLSQPETLPIKILPLVMVATQFVMQKMTPTTTTDPSQQKMMMIMPLVFGFMFYNLSSGLVLYYLTSNLVGIAQQWFFNKTAVAAEAALSV